MILLYIVSIVIIIYVMNRYFSGTQYSGNRPDLKGKYAVITGGNTGIGKQTALQLVQQGCHVIIGARDTQKSQATVKQIKQKTSTDLIEQYSLDLGDFQSIRNFSKNIKSDKVDFLVNNAGVMALPQRRSTKQGHQFQFGINHIGHFYLTHLLWAKLNKAQFFRVVNVSSLAHKKLMGFFSAPTFDPENVNYQKIKYDPNVSYSRSKLYNVLFTHALSERIPQNKGLSLSLHPGVVRTQLMRYMITGWKAIGYKIIHPIFCIFTKSPKEGAQTTVHCLFEQPSKLKNGGFYSDCGLSWENKHATKENWDKLWEISEEETKVNFGK